jgi:hypothetical protein
MKKHFTLALCLISLWLFSSTINAQTPPTELKYGKYSCSASKFNGSYIEYTPKGSFILTKNGSYSYLGFEKPSQGKFTVDKKGDIIFSGGYLDKGKAEKIDRPNKYFLVFPNIPENRWTCTYIEN